MLLSPPRMMRIDSGGGDSTAHTQSHNSCHSLCREEEEEKGAPFTPDGIILTKRVRQPKKLPDDFVS